MSDADPQREYAARREDRAREAARLARHDRRISNLRLGVFVALLGLAWAVLGAGRLSIGWLGAAAALFGVLLLVHDRVIRRRERADRAVAFYERGLARIGHRFAGTGVTGEAYLPEGHPYAADLDLFGRGSLFELLCTARTEAGEATLAGWLLAPAPPAVARERQVAAAELAGRLDLREDLALLGADVRAALDPETLRRWGEAPPVFASPRVHRALAPLLAAVSSAALGVWVLGPVGPVPFALALAVQGGYAAVLRGRVQQVLRGVDAPARHLDLFAALLGRLESERFEAPRLRALRAILETAGVPPSRWIARLHRRVELLDARRNQLFAPLGALWLWTTQLVLAIESWRHAAGPALGSWVEAVGELEALASLGGHAFEHPNHCFPELLEDGPRLEGRGLGHPLIPLERCVRNDLDLGGADPHVLVVSGSNMSGKSTWLRTVGTAAVLAQAGAPVRARALRLSPLRVGASIRIVDSLQAGESHFYAEVLRIRQVMELAGEGPTLFLLDEIFHGTNSHDRGIGAEAVVRGLLERGALGLVTTHDLALARVAEALAPRADNVHFQDHLEEGRIAFDYRMRPGVVRKSNALELMRAVGLPV